MATFLCTLLPPSPHQARSPPCKSTLCSPLLPVHTFPPSPPRAPPTVPPPRHSRQPSHCPAGRWRLGGTPRGGRHILPGRAALHVLVRCRGGAGWSTAYPTQTCPNQLITRAPADSHSFMHPDPTVGNVTERMRLGRVKPASNAPDGDTVVDLYTGIGYYTLPLLVHAGVEKVRASYCGCGEKWGGAYSHF